MHGCLILSSGLQPPREYKLMEVPNIYVFTDAGKPIFVRSNTNDDEEGASRKCSFLSSLRSSIVHGRLGLGDIQIIRSGSLRMSFMVVGSVILVAVIKVEEQDMIETEIYLRLVLEHVYANLIITLTDHALSLVAQNPSIDLRHLLGNADLAAGLFESSDPFVRTGAFLTGGVEPFFPLTPQVREAASLVLQDLNKDAHDYVFALILSDTKLVTLVQPSHDRHHVKNFDLHLFVSFIYRQPNIMEDDLWLPFCFPRFDASGFLHCYTNCLDVETKTVLVLVTQDPSLFEKARTDAATRVRPKLALPSYNSENILEIMDSQASNQVLMLHGSTDVRWRRSNIDDSGNDDDYEFIPHYRYMHATALITEIKSSVACFKYDLLLKDLTESVGIKHFVFRLDVSTDINSHHQHGSHLIQYISSGTSSDVVSDEQVWNSYRKLGLRLRLGSIATEPILDAFAMLDQVERDRSLATPGFEVDCPAMGLVESAPNLQGVCYIMDRGVACLAMNGFGKEDFELYLTAETANSSLIKDIASHGARLARRIILDQKEIFLSRPLAWAH